MRADERRRLLDWWRADAAETFTPGTIATYACAIDRFLRNRDLESVTSDAVRAHVRGLLDRPAACCTAASALRVFVAWAQPRGVLPWTPDFRIRPPSLRRAIAAARLEASAIDAAAPRRWHPRAAALFHVLRCTGLTASRAAALTMADVAPGCDAVCGRALDAEATEVLRAYVRSAAPSRALEGGGALFFNAEGPATRQAVWKALQTACRRNGQPPVTQRALRRHYLAAQGQDATLPVKEGP